MCNMEEEFSKILQASMASFHWGTRLGEGSSKFVGVDGCACMVGGEVLCKLQQELVVLGYCRPQRSNC